MADVIIVEVDRTLQTIEMTPPDSVEITLVTGTPGPKGDPGEVTQEELDAYGTELDVPGTVVRRANDASPWFEIHNIDLINPPTQDRHATRKDYVDTGLSEKANSSHTHAIADINATGTKDATTFLRGDGTWQTPPGGAGGGTVTSANITDASAVGRSVLTSADAAAARTAIGAGTGNSNLAIGTTSTTAKAGNYTPADASPTVKGLVQLAGDLYGTATTPLVRSAADRAYVRAFAATDLVVNGTGYLEDNTNFSNFTFDPTDSPIGGGSFDAPVGALSQYVNDELIPIDLSRRYLLRFQIKQKAPGVVSYFYGSISVYDVDGLAIAPGHYMAQANTTTTLAAALKPGDTTVTLASAANWNNAAGGSSHMRRFVVWNYVDGNGKAWPALTYSRRVSPVDSYADGAISGNVVTLRAPFDPTAWGYPAGTTIPAGTAISNGSSGGTFMYGTGMANLVTPETWTAYESIFVAGQMPVTNGGRGNATAVTGFPPGTAFVKLGWLLNGGSGGVGNIAGSRVSLASVSFSDATATEKDVRDATRNSIGGSLVRRDSAGDVIFNNVYAGNIADATTILTRKDYVDGKTWPVATISDSTTVGRSLVTAVNAAAARTAIGAGTSSLAIGTTSTTAKAGDYAPPSDGAAGVATMRTLGTGATQAAAGNHTHTAAAVGAVEAVTPGLKMRQMTQAAYDALGTKDANTLYVIQG